MFQKGYKKPINLSLGQQEDGRLADTVYYSNVEYKKLVDTGDFYLYYNLDTECYEIINGERLRFPTDESFGAKRGERCYASIEKLFNNVRLSFIYSDEFKMQVCSILKHRLE